MRSRYKLAALAAVTALWMRERMARRGAERVGAALFESLLNAIDANDADTGRHVRRVASYALELAHAAGLDDHQARAVERVALFHDIGKIHAALFDIVHEGARLTPEDRAAIATHPQRGADVLAPLEPFYPDLAEGVLSHHERWDGTGYPRGLAGEQIPLTARIVSIADSFDAITHARRYSNGQSLDAARSAILKGRGSQFDPELVDLFLDPSVQDRLHEPAPERAPGRRERRRGAEPVAPDVTFRWRTRGMEEGAGDGARALTASGESAPGSAVDRGA